MGLPLSLGLLCSLVSAYDLSRLSRLLFWRSRGFPFRDAIIEDVLPKLIQRFPVIGLGFDYDFHQAALRGRISPVCGGRVLIMELGSATRPWPSVFRPVLRID